MQVSRCSRASPTLQASKRASNDCGYLCAAEVESQSQSSPTSLRSFADGFAVSKVRTAKRKSFVCCAQIFLIEFAVVCWARKIAARSALQNKTALRAQSSILICCCWVCVSRFADLLNNERRKRASFEIYFLIIEIFLLFLRLALHCESRARINKTKTRAFCCFDCCSDKRNWNRREMKIKHKWKYLRVLLFACVFGRILRHFRESETKFAAFLLFAVCNLILARKTSQFCKLRFLTRRKVCLVCFRVVLAKRAKTGAANCSAASAVLCKTPKSDFRVASRQFGGQFSRSRASKAVKVCCFLAKLN